MSHVRIQRMYPIRNMTKMKTSRFVAHCLSLVHTKTSFHDKKNPSIQTYQAVLPKPASDAPDISSNNT
ncbi:MAG: hypothetical protein [Microviridae sp. ctjyu33]|nr:MAG: hypothetical protein [Microviridae sp. ctjyu33]